jgi:serine/threonine protein kinase
VQLLAALEYLHYDRHLVLRKFSPFNIRIDGNGNIRVGDFAFSSEREALAEMDPDLPCESIGADQGCPGYTAPELLMEQPATVAADIWSLGVTFFEIVTNRRPFEAVHIGRLHQKILREDPVFPSTVTPSLCDLLRRMLTKDPAQRITLENIKQHPWVVNENVNLSFALDFNGIESLRTRADPTTGFVDDHILKSVEALGIDVLDLPKQLLNGVQSDATTTYKQLLRREVTNALVDLVAGLLRRQARSQRFCHQIDISSHGSLPHFEPQILAMWKKPRSVASFERGNYLKVKRGPDLPNPQSKSTSPIPAGILPGGCVQIPRFCEF